jgi:copper chaperone CopZ
MSCQSAVQSALQSVKGVKEVNVSLANHEAVVTFDPSLVKIADLISAVDRAHGGMGHYTAKLKNKGS